MMKKGFTLIETLVAISIVMIAIVGPLAIASRGIAYSEYARNEITAFYLAQEAVDIARNLRDADWTNTETLFNACGAGNPNSFCSVDAWKFLSGEGIDAVFKSCNLDEVGEDGCRVQKIEQMEIDDTEEGGGRIFTKGIYYGGTEGLKDNLDLGDEFIPEDSQFTRTVQITKPSLPSPHENNEYRAVVTVTWDSRVGGKGQVMLNEDLFNLSGQ